MIYIKHFILRSTDFLLSSKEIKTAPRLLKIMWAFPKHCD